MTVSTLLCFTQILFELCNYHLQSNNYLTLFILVP